MEAITHESALRTELAALIEKTDLLLLDLEVGHARIQEILKELETIPKRSVVDLTAQPRNSN